MILSLTVLSCHDYFFSKVSMYITFHLISKQLISSLKLFDEHFLGCVRHLLVKWPGIYMFDKSEPFLNHQYHHLKYGKLIGFISDIFSFPERALSFSCLSLLQYPDCCKLFCRIETEDRHWNMKNQKFELNTLFLTKHRFPFQSAIKYNRIIRLKSKPLLTKFAIPWVIGSSDQDNQVYSTVDENYLSTSASFQNYTSETSLLSC